MPSISPDLAEMGATRITEPHVLGAPVISSSQLNKSAAELTSTTTLAPVAQVLSKRHRRHDVSTNMGLYTTKGVSFIAATIGANGLQTV